MTVAAVSYAYVSDSVHKGYFTEIDQRFIQEFQRLAESLAESSPALFLGLCWLTFSRLVLRRKANETYHVLSRDQREAAVTHFILALSDQ